jgi:GAF domain-containing protein
VAQLATELVSKGCSSTEKFVGVLQSSAVAKVLLDSGVEVAVRKRSKSSTRLSSSGVLSSALVPVTLGAEEVVLEVTCVDTRQTSGDHIDGLSSVASELVDVISNVMRSILAVNRLHQSDAVQAEKFSASAAHKVDKLQNHLKVARLELEDTVSKRKAIAADLMRQTERYEALRSQASSAVTSLCVPAIAEVAAMLEDVSVHQQSAGGDVGEVSEWAWNGLAKVTGRAVERISDGRFPHHVSVLVTSNLDNVNEGLSLRMYDGGALIAESFSAARASSGEAASALERAMRLGRGVLECSGDVVAPSDLLGVGHRLLGTLFGVTPTSRSGLSVLLITVPNARMGTSAVVRLIYCAADEGRQSSESKGEDLSGDEENFPASLLRPMLEMLTNLGASLIQSSAQHGAHLREVDLVRIGKDAETERADHAGVLLSRTRKMYRVVCREASVLLDAPIVGPGGVTPRATHPANLTPLAASQDCCLKLLGLVRTLLRSEGQALLLRDSGTEPTTYQVIHTGDSMHWPGVEQGTFGVVSAPSLSTVHLTTSRGERRSGSLAEAAMSSKRSVYTSDAANDSRYCSYLDGVCAVGTPSLTVPLRGRGGAVVGALIIARSKGATPFTPDDVAAAEMVAAFGSLSLYWCHGLGSLHHQLNRNVNKMEHLERAVQRLSIKQ